MLRFVMRVAIVALFLFYRNSVDSSFPFLYKEQKLHFFLSYLLCENRLYFNKKDNIINVEKLRFIKVKYHLCVYLSYFLCN